MIKSSTFGMGVAAFAGALALLSVAASAQGTTVAPVAPKATTQAPAMKPATPVTAPKTAPAKAAAVECKGKDEPTCKSAATECAWIVPKKVEANGKIDKAYCRHVAGVAVQKPAAAAKTTAPVPTAPAATATPGAAKK